MGRVNRGRKMGIIEKDLQQPENGNQRQANQASQLSEKYIDIKVIRRRNLQTNVGSN